MRRKCSRTSSSLPSQGRTGGEVRVESALPRQDRDGLDLQQELLTRQAADLHCRARRWAFGVHVGVAYLTQDRQIRHVTDEDGDLDDIGEGGSAGGQRRVEVLE